MSDLGRRIEKQVRDAVRAALARGPTNVGAVANVGTQGRSVSVYTDQDVTIVQRDGRTYVIHHGEESAGDRTGDDGRAGGSAEGDASSASS
jgi:monomeric isocitrate dehydrogenase